MKNALITGASRGLGRALAGELARRGWGLVIDARDAAELEQARGELADIIGDAAGPAKLIALAGDVTSETHRKDLAVAARQLGGLDAAVNNASALGSSPQPQLLDYPLDVLRTVYETNVISPLAIIQELRGLMRPGSCILNITSDAAVEAYAGWGGYGSSKAALEHLSAILAEENPAVRVYWVDPGDMRTQMQQEAFPGEDISDRPLPEASVPGLMELIEGRQASGRYKARELAPEKGK